MAIPPLGWFLKLETSQSCVWLVCLERRDGGPLVSSSISE